jgi:hypothetical protein
MHRMRRDVLFNRRNTNLEIEAATSLAEALGLKLTEFVRRAELQFLVGPLKCNIVLQQLESISRLNLLCSQHPNPEQCNRTIILL